MKYIFNKCGTNIYFFTLQRFGPSPSLILNITDFVLVFAVVKLFFSFNQKCPSANCKIGKVSGKFYSPFSVIDQVSGKFYSP